MEKNENKQVEVFEKISQAMNGFYSVEQIGIIQNSVAKGTTPSELAYFLSVAKSVSLNPFNKEIWCYKDGKGNVLIFTGRDGFLKKAQESPLYNGIRSIEVCEKDNFIVDIPNGKVYHEITDYMNRGAIMCAYAIVFRKDGEPTIEVANFNTYNKGYGVWKTDPASMIKKVAETHALKKAFGISGIQSEYDFDVKDGVAISIDHSNPKTELIAKKTELIELLSDCQVPEVQKIKDKCVKAETSGQFTMEFAEQMIEEVKELGNKKGKK